MFNEHRLFVDGLFFKWLPAICMKQIEKLPFENFKKTYLSHYPNMELEEKRAHILLAISNFYRQSRELY